jgi:hypothetical protein
MKAAGKLRDMEAREIVTMRSMAPIPYNRVASPLKPVGETSDTRSHEEEAALSAASAGNL